MNEGSMLGVYMIVKRIIKCLRNNEPKMIPIPTQLDTTELLKDKVALITGGSGGIGIAIAESFLRNGCKVIIAGTSQEKLDNSVKKLGGCENVRALIIDVTKVDSLTEKVELAACFYGKIDILVNCAGINCFSDFLDVSENEYDTVMNVNAKGTYFMSQAIAKYMINNAIKGHILNVTSSSALRPAKTPYHMSKWAVKGFTLGAADRLLPSGIIVNAIAPGPVATAMLGKGENDSIYKEGQPSGRYALPVEIANMAVLLVSDICNLVVGDTLYMTGGSGIISLHN